MSIYENEFSNFPYQKITKHDFKNVDDDISYIINKINSLRSQGMYDMAASLIKQNYNTLSHYIVDAVTYRTWEEEIYNTQKYAKQKQQSIHFEESVENVDCFEGDVWLGGI